MRLLSASRCASLLALVLAACHGGGGGGTTITAGIGATGGTLTGTAALAGVVLTVPAGTLASLTQISASTTGAAPRAGFTATGTAVLFQPEGLTFSPPATLVLPYDPAKVPAGANAANMVVERRDSAGNVTQLPPTSVDTGAHTVTVQLAGFSSYWPSIATPVAGSFVFAEYFPMGDGDTYSFTNGFTLYTLHHDDFGAPFPVTPLLSVNVQDGPDRNVTVLRREGNGDLSSLGELSDDTTQSQVELHEPAPFLSAVLADGVPVTANYAFQLFNAPDYTTPIATGSTEYSATPAPGAAVTVPAGQFADILRIEFRETRTINTEGAGTSVTTIDFARGVGPVRITDNDVVTAVLIGANVGGVVIGK